MIMKASCLGMLNILNTSSMSMRATRIISNAALDVFLLEECKNEMMKNKQRTSICLCVRYANHLHILC
jgi:hypothetical protein